MKAQRKLEHGQIMVLFVLAIIALFGVGALAIDGGRLYFQRRAAQSVSDDAAMTGALAILRGYSSTDIETIVLNRTKDNGFDNDEEDVTVEVYWPPVSPNPYAGNPNYIQVFITSEIPPYLAHFVFQGSLQVTVEAIGHIRPTGSIVPGYTIYGTNPSACRTVEFSGNPFVKVTGGGSIGSNSDADCPCGSLVSGGNFTIDVLGGGEITAAGCWVNNGVAGAIDPEPTPYVDPLELNELRDSIPIPNCTGFTDYFDVSLNGVETIEPGRYESMKFTAGAVVTMEPGLYCIYGDDPWIMSATGDVTIQGDGIMIYLMSTAGSWKTGGGSQINLTASTDLDPVVDALGVEWAGMLIYSHPDNTNQIVLTGTSNSVFEGSIYALGSYCVIEGTSGGVAFISQIICDTIEVGGTGDLDVDFKEGEVYQVPAALDLSK